MHAPIQPYKKCKSGARVKFHLSTLSLSYLLYINIYIYIWLNGGSLPFIHSSCGFSHAPKSVELYVFSSCKL